jgi:hypothetical protein
MKIIDFISRNATWLLLAVLSIYFISFQKQVLDTALIIVLLESIALGLSGLAVYAFTTFSISEPYFVGDDKQYSVMERLGLMLWAGMVFLGVHILVGLAVVGIYVIQAI